MFDSVLFMPSWTTQGLQDLHSAGNQFSR